MFLGYSWRENCVKKERISQHCRFIFSRWVSGCSTALWDLALRFGERPFLCKPQSCTECLAPWQSRCKRPNAQADFLYNAHFVSGQSRSIQIIWVVLLQKCICTFTIYHLVPDCSDVFHIHMPTGRSAPGCILHAAHCRSNSHHQFCWISPVCLHQSNLLERLGTYWLYQMQNWCYGCGYIWNKCVKADFS